MPMPRPRPASASPSTTAAKVFRPTIVGNRDGVEMKVEDGSLRIRSTRTAHAYVGRNAAALTDARRLRRHRRHGRAARRPLLFRRPARRHHQYRRPQGSSRRDRGGDQPSARSADVARQIAAQPDHRRHRGRRRDPGRRRRPGTREGNPRPDPGRLQGVAGAAQGAGGDPLRRRARRHGRPANWRAPMHNVLVTGGSRGIGLAIARRLAAAGYQRDRGGAARKRRAEGRDRRSRQAGQGPAFPAFDLGEIDAIPAFVKALRDEFGADLWPRQQCRHRHRGPARHHAQFARSRRWCGSTCCRRSF